MRNSCLTGNFLIPEVPLNAYNFHFYSNHCIDAYWPVDDSNYNNMFAPESQIFVVWWRRSKYSSADDSCANVLWCLLLLVHTSNWNPVLDISSFSITLLLILVVVNQRLPAHRADCLPVHEIDDSMGWYLDTFLLGGAIMQLILGKLHLASHFSTQATWAAWSLEALQPGSTNFRQKSVNYLAGRSSNHSQVLDKDERRTCSPGTKGSRQMGQAAFWLSSSTSSWCTRCTLLFRACKKSR